jgi:hypothetical protein
MDPMGMVSLEHDLQHFWVFHLDPGTRKVAGVVAPGTFSGCGLGGPGVPCWLVLETHLEQP